MSKLLYITQIQQSPNDPPPGRIISSPNHDMGQSSDVDSQLGITTNTINICMKIRGSVTLPNSFNEYDDPPAPPLLEFVNTVTVRFTRTLVFLPVSRVVVTQMSSRSLHQATLYYFRIYQDL